MTKNNKSKWPIHINVRNESQIACAAFDKKSIEVLNYMAIEVCLDIFTILSEPVQSIIRI